MEEESFSKKARNIVLAVGSYWVVSILMVFLNKYLLSSPELKFDAPLFVTWFQCVFCFLLYSFFLSVKRKYPDSIQFFPLFTLESNIAIKVLPLSIIFVAMIMFNNLSLKYISVSFYMIVRSLSTVFNVILVYIYFGEKTSLKAITCCFVITVGFVLGIQQENSPGNLTLTAISFGVLSSLFAALNGVYIKKTIKLVDDNLWKLNYLTNFYASIIFIPFIILSGELGRVIKFDGIFSLYFWFAMLVSGLLGFLIGYVTSLQVKVTSPLTHNISGTTKSYIQTILGVVAYNEVKTQLWWMSNFLVLIGAAMYSHVRTKEMQEKHKNSHLNQKA